MRPARPHRGGWRRIESWRAAVLASRSRASHSSDRGFACGEDALLYRGVFPGRAAQVQGIQPRGADRALLEHLSLGAIGIVLHLAPSIEDHHRTLLGPVSRPPGKTGVVGIAVAGEVDPRVAHPGRQTAG